MLRFFSVVTVCLVVFVYAASVQSRTVNYPVTPVTQQCLGCLCEAISGCNTTWHCEDDVCGPFAITRPYWEDSDMPTLNGEALTSTTAYANCVVDPNCAARAVQKYMSKFQEDCNGDGKIDCDDYAALHYLGAGQCQGALPGYYQDRYIHCKRLVGGSN